MPSRYISLAQCVACVFLVSAPLPLGELALARLFDVHEGSVGWYFSITLLYAAGGALGGMIERLFTWIGAVLSLVAFGLLLGGLFNPGWLIMFGLPWTVVACAAATAGYVLKRHLVQALAHRHRGPA